MAAPLAATYARPSINLSDSAHLTLLDSYGPMANDACANSITIQAQNNSQLVWFSGYQLTTNGKIQDLAPPRSRWRNSISVELSGDAKADVAFGSNPTAGTPTFKFALSDTAEARVVLVPQLNSLGAYEAESSGDPIFQVGDQAKLSLFAYPDASVALPAFFQAQYLYSKGPQAEVTLNVPFATMKSILHLGAMQEAKP